MDSLQVVSQTNDCLSKRPHEDQARSNVRRESDIMRVDHVKAGLRTLGEVVFRICLKPEIAQVESVYPTQ